MIDVNWTKVVSEHYLQTHLCSRLFFLQIERQLIVETKLSLVVRRVDRCEKGDRIVFVGDHGPFLSVNLMTCKDACMKMCFCNPPPGDCVLLSLCDTLLSSMLLLLLLCVIMCSDLLAGG